jgi:hypothetical protein
MAKMSYASQEGQLRGSPYSDNGCLALRCLDLLELVPKRRTISSGFFQTVFSLFMLLITSTDITVWIVSALLALGIGAGKYAKWKARNELVRQLAAMDRERREKVLSRMNPAQAMEARQELMRRFNIF